MPNMSYCRFENTYRALVDCVETLETKEVLSKDEYKYMRNMRQQAEEFLELSENYTNLEKDVDVQDYSHSI